MAGTLVLTSAEISSWMNGLFWPFTRIAAALAIAPVFGARMVPVRVRLLIAVSLTLVVAPLLGPAPAVDALSVTAVVVTIQQMLIGLILGFGVQLVFAAFVLAGQTTAMGMGLGFASMVDPQNGVQVPVVGQYFVVTATLLFLAMNGHLAMIRVLVDSFELLPVGTDALSREAMNAVAHWGGRLFADAVLVALPAVAAILLANLSFGVVSRAAPQLNIFGVGFPVVMTLGFVALIFAVPNLLPQLQHMLDNSFSAIVDIEQMSR